MKLISAVLFVSCVYGALASRELLAADSACSGGATCLLDNPKGKKQCVSGEYCKKCNNGNGNSGQCNQCPAGSYSAAAGGLSCTLCDPMTYSAAGATSCSPCPAGTYSGAGAAGCAPCTPIANCAAATCTDPTNTVCSQCESGYTLSPDGKICSPTALPCGGPQFSTGSCGATTVFTYNIGVGAVFDFSYNGGGSIADGFLVKMLPSGTVLFDEYTAGSATLTLPTGGETTVEITITPNSNCGTYWDFTVNCAYTP